MTQLGQRKLAQSTQRATASDSFDLQPVQRAEGEFVWRAVGRRSASCSTAAAITRLGSSPCTPAGGSWLSTRHVTQVTLSGCVCSLSRQPRQNVWKQFSTLGSTNVSRQIAQVVSRPSNSRRSHTAESLAGGEEPLRVKGDKEPRSSEPIELAPGSDSRDGVREAIFRKPASLEQNKIICYYKVREKQTLRTKH